MYADDLQLVIFGEEPRFVQAAPDKLAGCCVFTFDWK